LALASYSPPIMCLKKHVDAALLLLKGKVENNRMCQVTELAGQSKYEATKSGRAKGICVATIIAILKTYRLPERYGIAHPLWLRLFDVNLRPVVSPAWFSDKDIIFVPLYVQDGWSLAVLYRSENRIDHYCPGGGIYHYQKLATWAGQGASRLTVQIKPCAHVNSQFEDIVIVMSTIESLLHGEEVPSQINVPMTRARLLKIASGDGNRRPSAASDLEAATKPNSSLSTESSRIIVQPVSPGPSLSVKDRDITQSTASNIPQTSSSSTTQVAQINNSAASLPDTGSSQQSDRRMGSPGSYVEKLQATIDTVTSELKVAEAMRLEYDNNRTQEQTIQHEIDGDTEAMDRMKSQLSGLVHELCKSGDGSKGEESNDERTNQVDSIPGDLIQQLQTVRKRKHSCMSRLEHLKNKRTRMDGQRACRAEAIAALLKAFDKRG
ncbi:hypothetical protein CI238_11612, partial [Colletotrichum incanum]